ncbi:MAG: serine hydrolase domain-containing protein [Nannocystales bacterium]
MAEQESRPKRRWGRRIGAAAAVLLGGAGVLATIYVLPTATGYVAKLGCSGVFVAGQSAERLMDEELSRMGYVSLSVDTDSQRARATVFGLAAREAVYREGIGCALVVDADPDEVQGAGLEVPRAPVSRAPWPEGSGEDTRPDPPGLDRAALELAIDHVFEEPDPESMRWTRAVVVIWDGRLVAERYAPWTSADAPHLGWSMTKSVTNAMVGALVLRGDLDRDGLAPIPQWSGDDRAGISLDALMRMSSGLEFEERYGPLADATHMLFEVDDAAAVARVKPLAVSTDTEFSYSSGTTNLLAWIVRLQFDSDDAYHRFPHEALFAPLGMRSAVFETDASGTFVGSSFLYASGRDWARFGQLYLQDGIWRGERVLPAGWAEYSGTASTTAKNGEYGAQFWTNAGPPDDPSARPDPDVPAGAFKASGYQGQLVYVVPSRKAVVVRLGMTHDRASWDANGFTAEVLAALPD